MTSKAMFLLDAAYEILHQAGEPLHFREITRRILDQGLWQTRGATPERTLNAQLSKDIKNNGSQSRFCKTGKGSFALNEAAHALKQEYTKNQKSSPRPFNKQHTMSFTDAAAHVLEKFGQKQPMHYRQVTEKALELGLLNTSGRTPEATMYAQVLVETKRRKKSGETPRFVMHGKGYVGLTRWMSRGLGFEIEQHNRSVRKKLHERIRKMDPGEFEELVGELLASLGFEEITVTERHGDGGIDVRGTLVVGEVIKTQMAVQVKRWKNNVQSGTVQQVRGSLGTHEQGLIVTTSDFSRGARDEAERVDAIPVALMNGEQLVRLLAENDIGVTREAYELFELDEAPDDNIV